MAMALFSALVEKKGQKPEDWHIASAGCWAYAGFPATTNAKKAMQASGLSLEEHLSQPVTESLLEKFNLILCMEIDHKRFLQRNFPASAQRSFLLSEMVNEEIEVNDPVGLPIKTYKSTVNKLLYYLEEGFNKIINLSA